MKIRLFSAFLTVILCSGQVRAEATAQPIDLVICLDTSGSMELLIDSARGRIWDIVFELSKATPTPSLRVGLLTFGTPETSSAEQGWVVHQIGLTDDLDSVYAKMMALKTVGGDEFVGWVLSDAVDSMKWSERPDALKLVFVAGNESAHQGADKRNFRNVGADAKRREIIINPIYAGERQQGVNEGWEEVATHGGGDFHSIDVAEGAKQMATRYDAELNLLNHELNATYIPFGPKGTDGIANQVAQDANAGKLGAQSCSSRVAAKGCGLYNNAEWDLVDASQKEGFDLAKIKVTDLPEVMRSMSHEQRGKHVRAMHTIRAAIQKQIVSVNDQRSAFIQEANRQSGKLSLSGAMMKSLRTQARAKGFTFPEPMPVVESQLVMVGPVPPKVPLRPEIVRNIDAILGALPTVEYRVGSYVTGIEELAELFIEHSGGKIAYHVEGETAATAIAAEGIVARLLREKAAALQEVRVVDIPLSSPFPYADAANARISKRHQIGGINFNQPKSAEVARERIVAAVAKFKSDHGGDKASNQKVVLAAHSKPESADPALEIESLRAMIRTIGAAAGRTYMELGDGC